MFILKFYSQVPKQRGELINIGSWKRIPKFNKWGVRMNERAGFREVAEMIIKRSKATEGKRSSCHKA